MPEVRLLVCGGRDFTDWSFLFAALNSFDRDHFVDVVIEGECPTRENADKLAAEWARAKRRRVAPFPVNHRLDGPWPGAGPRRNARMLRIGRPTHAAAFPRADGHIGNGTADMLAQLRVARVPIWLFDDLKVKF